MKTILQRLKNIWKDESGQGATEYILMLVIVVSIAVFFGKDLKDMLSKKVQALSGEVQGFTN